MTQIPVERFVINTISQACNCESMALTPEMDIADLGIDSLILTTVAAHVEATYDCELTELDMQRLLESRIINDIVEVVRHVLDCGARRAPSLCE